MFPHKKYEKREFNKGYNNGQLKVRLTTPFNMREIAWNSLKLDTRQNTQKAIKKTTNVEPSVERLRCLVGR